MFYEKLEREVQKKNINMNTLAKETGIAQPTTNSWKNGGLPSATALVKICRYLKVSADYLLDLDDTPPPPNISDQEEQLLKDFRQCGPETKRNIVLLASAGAQETLKEKTSSELKNIG